MWIISGHVLYPTLSPYWTFQPGIRADPSDITSTASVRARASDKEDAALEMVNGNNHLRFLSCIINNGSRSR